MGSKQLKVMSTTAVNNDLKDQMLELTLHMVKNFEKQPYDMFVITAEDSHAKVRVAGYHFETGDLNEETVMNTIPVKIPSTIWFKIDDYGEYYVGTFLYPSEY